MSLDIAPSNHIDVLDQVMYRECKLYRDMVLICHFGNSICVSKQPPKAISYCQSLRRSISRKWLPVFDSDQIIHIIASGSASIDCKIISIHERPLKAAATPDKAQSL